MPANLNALIRYKTINNCLAGGRRKWSIGELVDACSEALAEARGRYEPVSERTLRDDIRVMRSDILGFNAPIAQEKGLYFYSDPGYSIMSIRITDSGLAGQIIKMLLEIRTTTRHPELEIILEKLIGLTGGLYQEISAGSKEEEKKPAAYTDKKNKSLIRARKEAPDVLFSIDEVPPAMPQESAIMFIPKESYPSWEELFRILGA